MRPFQGASALLLIFIRLSLDRFVWPYNVSTNSAQYPPFDFWSLI